MTNDSIIARIQKLMALAASPNEHEAAVAAGMAAKLMAQHGIEEAALAVDTAEDRAEAALHIEDVVLGGLASASWRGRLAMAAAFPVNGQTYRSGDSLRIVIEAGKVAQARELYDLLVRQVDHWTGREAHGMGRAYANAYRLGMATTIYGRLEEATRLARTDARKQLAESGTALVVIDRALARMDREQSLVKAKVATLGLRSQGRTRTSSRDGYAAGQRDGHRVTTSVHAGLR